VSACLSLNARLTVLGEWDDVFMVARSERVSAIALSTLLIGVCGGCAGGRSVPDVRACLVKAGATARLVTEVDAEAKDWPNRLVVRLRDGTTALVGFFTSANAAANLVGQVRGAYLPAQRGKIGFWYFNQPTTADRHDLQSCVE
jgi:hypothetical protein